MSSRLYIFGKAFNVFMTPYNKGRMTEHLYIDSDQAVLLHSDIIRAFLAWRLWAQQKGQKECRAGGASA